MNNNFEGMGEDYNKHKKQYKEIDSSDISEGMILVHRSEIENEHNEGLLVMWAGASRDGNIVVRDSNGHDYFVDPAKEDYLQEISTVIAYRVLYGKNIESELKVSDEWYTDLASFIKEANHDRFCKLIWVTDKHVPIK